MAPAGIEPVTFRFVAQHLNHCTTTVPNSTMCIMITGYEGQSSLELAQNIHWWILSVALKFWDFLHIHSLVFSLEGQAWQEPEPSHVTGMALAHCILDKFLGVVCHCFPPPLDVPTLATRCLRPQ